MGISPKSGFPVQDNPLLVCQEHPYQRLGSVIVTLEPCQVASNLWRSISLVEAIQITGTVNRLWTSRATSADRGYRDIAGFPDMPMPPTRSDFEIMMIATVGTDRLSAIVPIAMGQRAGLVATAVVTSTARVLLGAHHDLEIVTPSRL